MDSGYYLKFICGLFSVAININIFVLGEHKSLSSCFAVLCHFVLSAIEPFSLVCDINSDYFKFSG
jgi:hypothetical protein